MTLPSSDEIIQYRPFLVKEEKLLLIALESDSEIESVKSLKQVLRNCILSDIDIDTLSVFDLEYIFIQLRSKSVGEKSELSFICKGEDCTNILKTTIDLTEIEVIKNKNHTNKIELTDTIGLLMKCPSFDSFVKHTLLASKHNEADSFFELLIDCIDAVYDGEQIHSHKDVTREEIINFVEHLTQQQTEKIKEFFNTLPKLEKKIDLTCKKCGQKTEVVLETFSDFFGVDSLMSP